MNWLWTIAITKALKKLVQLVVSWLIAQNLDQFGVHLDKVQLTAAIFTGLELLRNWLKVKLGWKIL